jgi:small subunit ribosomal protein S4
MARYIGPKQRLQRQIGEDLGLKSNALKTAKKINIKPGQHGQRRSRRLSDYGLQLKEKQKVKYLYGVLEKQLKKTYNKAAQSKTGTGFALLQFLERRLDNVLYRLGWTPTRAAARQLVAHGHVQVNGRKMDVPSYLVKVEDVITLKKSATNIPAISVKMADEAYVIPDWLERKYNVGKVVRYPERDEIDEKIDEQLIVEFYSR